MERAILRMSAAAVLTALALAGPGPARAEAGKCESDAEAASKEAAVRSFFQAVAEGRQHAAAAMLETPADYESTVRAPLGYAEYEPMQVILRVGHAFSFIRLCTYRDHGGMIMSDAEVYDDADIVMLRRRGTWHEARRFYHFFHFHYAGDNRLTFAPPFTKPVN